MQLKVTKLSDFLNEALPLSLAKKVVSIPRNQEVDNILTKAFSKFGTKERIYLDFPQEMKESLKTILEEGCSSFNSISRVLKNNGIEIIDFINNVAKEPRQNNPTKITKVLSKLGHQELLAEYEKDYTRKDLAKKTDIDFKIVISKAKYDIAGMSTDRKWVSCMRLDTSKEALDALGKSDSSGINAHYVQRDIKEGTIISYIIFADDTNIKNPLGRVLIKPFVDSDDEDNILWYPETVCYGNILVNNVDVKRYYVKEIKKWVMDNINTISIKRRHSVFTKKDNLYNDDNIKNLKLDDGTPKPYYPVTKNDRIDVSDVYVGTVSVGGVDDSFDLDLDGIYMNSTGQIDPGSIRRFESEVESVINSGMCRDALWEDAYGEVDTHGKAFELWKEELLSNISTIRQGNKETSIFKHSLKYIVEFLDLCIGESVLDNIDEDFYKMFLTKNWIEGNPSDKVKGNRVVKNIHDVAYFIDQVFDDRDSIQSLENTYEFDDFKDQVNQDDDVWLAYFEDVSVSVSLQNKTEWADEDEIKRIKNEIGYDPHDFDTYVDWEFDITDVSGGSFSVTFRG